MKIWVDDGVVQLVFGIDNEDARTVQCGCSNRNRIVRNEQNRLAFRETTEGCQVDGLMVGVILYACRNPQVPISVRGGEPTYSSLSIYP